MQIYQSDLVFFFFWGGGVIAIFKPVSLCSILKAKKCENKVNYPSGITLSFWPLFLAKSQVSFDLFSFDTANLYQMPSLQLAICHICFLLALSAPDSTYPISLCSTHPSVFPPLQLSCLCVLILSVVLLNSCIYFCCLALLILSLQYFWS